MHAATKADDKKADELTEKADKKAKPKVAEHDFATAITTIASGIKQLTESGVGGGEASKLAFAVWERCHCD